MPKTDYETLPADKRLILFDNQEMVVTTEAIPELLRLLAVSIMPQSVGASGVAAFVGEHKLSVEWNPNHAKKR
jgi:hypothetical protein